MSSRNQSKLRLSLQMAMIGLWLGTLTLTMQFWVGDKTVYATEVAAKREHLHQILLANEVPAGGWKAIGANGTNIRVVTPYLAQNIHEVSGLSVSKSYLVLDTVMLFAALVLLFCYLKRFVNNAYAVLGVTFVGSILPLSYQLFYFHPWDRFSLFTWIALLMLLHAERLVLFALLLPLAVAVKYDIMLLPGLYGLHALVRDRRLSLPVVLRSGALLAIGAGTYVLLGILRPDGTNPTLIGTQVATNIDVLMDMNLRWPPFLGFAVPAALALIGFQRSTPWAQAGVLFGMLLMIPFSLQSNLAEFRAHMPVLVLLAPAALAGLGSLLQDQTKLTTASIT